jgi:hypothetical protein
MPNHEGRAPSAQVTELRVSLSTDEVLLLRSALCTPDAAVESWIRFCEGRDLSQLPDSMSRLLPLVARNVLTPAVSVPGQRILRGVRRATWVQNMSRIDSYRRLRGMIRGADRFVLLKGAATLHHGMDTASRAMSDIDVFVPNALLRDVLKQMEDIGFTPRGLGNMRDVVERHRYRAVGCNVTHPEWGEVDVHWGLATNVPLSRLSIRQQERLVTRTCRLDVATGLRYCSKELLAVHTLQHMVRQDPNSKLSVMQGLCDITNIQRALPSQSMELLLQAFELRETYQDVISFLESVVEDDLRTTECVTFETRAESSMFVPEVGKWLDKVETVQRIDSSLELPRLRWSWLYVLWQFFGGGERLEQLLRRMFGVFTSTQGKVCTSAEFSFEAGCACDNHVGVGWTPWIPSSRGVWSDRRDCRVLLRIPPHDSSKMRIVLVLTLGQEWVHSPYESVEVVANGHKLGAVQRAERDTGAGTIRRFDLQRSLREETIVELSFRPVSFVPRRMLGLGTETHRLGIALHSIRLEVIPTT